MRTITVMHCIVSTELLNLITEIPYEEGYLLTCEDLSVSEEIIEHDLSQLRSLLTYSAWLKLNEKGNDNLVFILTQFLP